MASVRIGKTEIGKGIPKICVPVLGKTEEEILLAAKDASSSQADLAELRIDWYEYVKNPNKVLSLTLKVRELLGNLPFIFTLRTVPEGGRAEVTEDEYCCIQDEIIKNKAADLMDIELFLGDDLVKNQIKKSHEYGIYTIVSNHDFEGTPEQEEVLKRLKRMDLLGADILKMAALPKSERDVLRMMEAALVMKEEYTKKPLVIISMGEAGVVSRLTGELFGSAITFGTVGKVSAPGQLPAEELKKTLHYLHIEKKKKLFLTGFMGAGKSTIAKGITAALGASLIEMDEELEQMEGMPVAKIFEVKGEAYFRDLESKLINEIQGRENSVVSCGGGAVLREENVANMKKAGTIVYLKASPETVFERVRYAKTRPILNDNMNLTYVRELMEKRVKIYEETADFIIETDGKSEERICNEILMKLLNIEE